MSDPIDKNKLTTFDVEYLFTRIRAKSVGETAKTGLKCENCEHPNEVIIPIEEIKIDVPDIDSKIEMKINKIFIRVFSLSIPVKLLIFPKTSTG